MGRTSDAKEKLLNVAFQLIWDNSYSSVSIDQICDRAQVNKGSFYYYFKTKTELVVEAYEEHWRLKQPELDAIFSTQTPPMERIRKWCAYVQQGQQCKASAQGSVCGCPYVSVGMEMATQDPKIRVKMEQLMERSIKYLENALAEAHRTGAVVVENPRLAAQLTYAMGLGMLVHAKVKNDLGLLCHLESSVMSLLKVSPSVPAA